MILVTAYPLGYAVVLSLYKYRLTDPEGKEFVGLKNYVTVLTDPVWWNAVSTTAIITVVSVAVELVLGFGFAWVMYRIVQGRSFVRTAILVPYGIITVVSAFVWRYAFQLDSGFVNQWFGLDDFNWFGERWSSLFVITLVGDLEDHAVHLPAAARRPRAGARGAAGGGDGRRRHGLATPVEGGPAEHEGGDHGRRAVPHARRLADLRQPVRHDPGANNTETLSFLAYRQNVTLVNLGAGSAVSVLLFFTVVIIAFIFIKGFKTDLSQVRGES